MKKQEKILLWCVRIAGILATVLLVVFFLGLYPVMLFPKGDLFRLTSVESFDEPFSPPYRIDESVQTASQDASIVWWIGDSFSVVQFGHKPFPERYSEKYGIPLWFSHYNHFGARGLELLEKLKELPSSKRPKVLLLECVERNLYDLSGFLNVKGNFGVSLFPSSLALIRERFFISATPSIDFNWRRFLPVSFIRKHLDTYRYEIYGDHHPLATPQTFESYRYLEFADDNFENYESSDIESMVQIFSEFSAEVEKLGVQVVFAFPPNRNYFYRFKNREDKFALALYSAMDKHGLNYVNLHEVLFKEREKGVNLYWNTDSHWNSKAVEVSVDALHHEINKILIKE